MTAQVVSHREHPDPFVRFPREILENPSLSFKAKALLAWLLDKGDFPGGWETEVARICAITSEGRDAIRATLAELEIAGYLTRLDSGHGGRGVKMVWHVHDHVLLPENPEVTGEPERIIRHDEAENPSYAPTHRETSLSKTRDGVGKRRSHLPSDFQLTEPRLLDARKRGLDDLTALEEIEKFRNHHLAHGSKMADWDAAWRTWLGFYNRWAAPKGKPSQMDEIARVVALREAEAAR